MLPLRQCALTTRYMTPVMLLSDGYLSNASEPWLTPDINDYKPFPVTYHQETEDFSPSRRDASTLARVWARPGTPGLEHRIGGIEKDYDTGDISYDADNHHRMTRLRKAKVDSMADDLPEQTLSQGEADDDLLVIGWGSTFGPIHQAVKRLREEGTRVSHAHIRYMWPLPKNLGELISGFREVLVPEMNTGQLLQVIRSEYLVDAQGLNKISGKTIQD